MWFECELRSYARSQPILPELRHSSYCSPRGRARRSAEILNLGAHYHQYFCQETGEVETTTKPPEMAEVARSTIQLTSRLDEWGYGEYEGLTIREISQKREESGEKPWRIWDDGCPGGEYAILP